MGLLGGKGFGRCLGHIFVLASVAAACANRTRDFTIDGDRNAPRKDDCSAAKAVEENTPVDEDTSTQLTPADLEVARSVYVGDMKCELGATVTVKPMKREGFFLVTTKGYRFRMHPHESRTGAIRLEDPKAGAVWLQLSNKSMLMNQKLGQRLADECMSPDQAVVAELLIKEPAPSLLDAMPPVVEK